MKEYTKEIICVKMEVGNDFIRDIDIKSGFTAESFIEDELTVIMKATIMSRLSEVQKTSVYIDRPKFIDWLFRKRKRIEIDVKATDILKTNPGTNEVRMFSIEKI